MDKKGENFTLPTDIKRNSDSPKALLSFIKNSRNTKDPLSKAINTILIEDSGLSRDKRKEKILQHFSNKSSEDAKMVESILNKTMGLDNRQLDSVLNLIRLKSYKDSKKFFNVLDECILQTWIEE